MTKYNAKKVIVDDIQFDSLVESQYYLYLKSLKELGKVTHIEPHPEFLLQEGFKKNGKTFRPIKYIADFEVKYADGRLEIVDVKGMVLPEFKLKQKLFEYKYPHLSLILLTYVKKRGGWITLEENEKQKKLEKKQKKSEQQ